MIIINNEGINNKDSILTRNMWGTIIATTIEHDNSNNNKETIVSTPTLWIPDRDNIISNDSLTLTIQTTIT